jgi:phenylalanyl-tRNA synthetase beta chain
VNVSRRWLEAFLRRPLEAADVGERLAAHGAPVETIEPLYQGLGDIRVALVEAVRPHPNAGRLRLCSVNDGTEQRKQVVCGAPNVTAGRKYPFAPVGASVPVGKGGAPMTIERAMLRGETSEGMLCSARELGVGIDADGIWELDTPSPPGARLLDALPLDDERIIVDVSPNRPDLLCHKGVARELGASLNLPLRLPEIPGAESIDVPREVRAHGVAEGRTGSVTIRIEDRVGCQRFHAAVIRGVRVGPSPAWLRLRLEAVGVRPISNIVDVTNYVMFELNQPMHAYDLARVKGPEIVVRRAAQAARVTTLDGTEREIAPDMTVIADAERVVGIAGVMGGANTEVSATTRDVLLEAAYWQPSGIRRTRRALGLSSEASYRFERGIDLWAGADAMRRAIALVLATTGGTLADAPVDVWPGTAHPPRIFLRLSRVAQVLGLELGLHEVERCLVAIGATVVAKPDDGRVAVDVPGWRPDLREEIDLVEEVARIHGYDRVPTELRPFRVGSLPEAPAAVAERAVRQGLIAQGLTEVVSLPFGPARDGDVALINPLADTGAHLRRRLLPTLVRHAERNWNNHVRDVRLFEIGTVFRAAAPGNRPAETVHAAAVVTGHREPDHWTEPAKDTDIWDLKCLAAAAAALAYPGATWHVQGHELVARTPEGREVGWAGRLNADAPPWAGGLFGVEVEVTSTGRAPVKVSPLPVTPGVTRDVSLVVLDGIPAASLATTARSVGGALLESVCIVGEFRGPAIGEGHRSLTLRLTFRAPDRTLRDAEVDSVEAQILAALVREHGVSRRRSSPEAS